MRVAKWGNSLAIRLPSAVVEALHLKEGEAVEVRVVGERSFEIDRNSDRIDALNRLRGSRRQLPEDFKFIRDEAHERSGFL